jgi:hypothetical protein
MYGCCLGETQRDATLVEVHRGTFGCVIGVQAVAASHHRKLSIALGPRQFNSVGIALRMSHTTPDHMVNSRFRGAFPTYEHVVVE